MEKTEINGEGTWRRVSRDSSHMEETTLVSFLGYCIASPILLLCVIMSDPQRVMAREIGWGLVGIL